MSLPGKGLTLEFAEFVLRSTVLLEPVHMSRTIINLLEGVSKMVREIDFSGVLCFLTDER